MGLHRAIKSIEYRDAATAIMTDKHAYRRERRALQCAIALAALVPISAGLAGMLLGVAAFQMPMQISVVPTHASIPFDAALDSHLRYLSGLLLGLGLSFWAMIPRIERHAIPVRILTVMVVMGGIARLIAAITIAAPSIPMQLAIGMELIATPLICWWQARIAKRADVE